MMPQLAVVRVRDRKGHRDPWCREDHRDAGEERADAKPSHPTDR